MPLLNLEDVNLYYEIQGKGHPLILISGLSDDHNSWVSTINLINQNFQIITLDNRGAGQTRASNHTYTIEIMAKDVIQLLDSLQIEKCYILGHSMGGFVAQQLAITYPHRVERLVIYASSAKLNSLATLVFGTNLALWKVKCERELLLRNIMPWLLSKEFLSTPSNIQGFIEFSLLNPYLPSLENFEGQLNACKAFDARSELSSIICPTLVLAGMEDLLTPVEDSLFLANGIPNAVLKVMPQLAHLLHAEQPIVFADIVKEFLI